MLGPWAQQSKADLGRGGSRRLVDHALHCVPCKSLTPCMCPNRASLSQAYFQTIAPGAELSVEYKFTPHHMLPPANYIVALTVFYEGEQARARADRALTRCKQRHHRAS